MGGVMKYIENSKHDQFSLKFTEIYGILFAWGRHKILISLENPKLALNGQHLWDVSEHRNMLYLYRNHSNLPLYLLITFLGRKAPPPDQTLP